MDASVVLNERLGRIMKAVRLEKPDRIPVVLEYAGFAAQAAGRSMAEFVSSPARATEIMIEAYHQVGGGDAVNYGTFTPRTLSNLFLSKVRIPGRDLPENQVWQVDEKELLTRDDYGLIREMGWPEFYRKFMEERILEDLPSEMRLENLPRTDVRAAWAEIGVPVLMGGDVTTPLELLSGGRSMMEFFTDLFEIPDEVEETMEAICPHLAEATCRRARAGGFPGVWVGGWRAAPSMLSPTLWDRFAWPYFKRLVEEVVEAGLIAILHLDSNWTSRLDRFRELPGGRCIMALDGETDIFEAKRVVGDHLGLMGDVPASLFYWGRPEEVRSYCRKLIREIGPEGFILQSGCDIPANAALENVRTMVETALEA